MTTVCILSDVHARRGHADAIRETLVSIRDRLAAREPAHVFVLGDLIEDATAPADREHVRLVASAFEDCPAPVTYLLGNHDVGNLTRGTLGDLLSQEGFYGRVKVGGQPFVYLDSAVAGAGARGALGAAQREWLDEQLSGDEIVLLHHAVGPVSLADNPWFSEYPERALLWDRKELLDLLEGRALATINGHVHQTERTAFRGLTHVAINAVSKETPDTPVTGTYGVLSLDGPPTLSVAVGDREIASFSLA